MTDPKLVGETMTKLKPCFFCGGKQYDKPIPVSYGPKYMAIVCPHCDARGPKTSSKMGIRIAIKAWNTRKEEKTNG